MKQLLFLQAAELEASLTNVQKLWDQFWPGLRSFLVKVLISIIIYIIGKKLIKFSLKLGRKAFERAKADVGVTNFSLTVMKILLYGVLIIVIAEILGMPTASFVAILGSAGLTIGLALQGSLSNFAGGVLILLLKPFRIGDFIIANGHEGTVTAVDIFYTKILTADNKFVVLPNGALSNSNITNVTNEPIRRLDLVVPISYSDDIKAVKDELTKITLRHEKVLKDQPMDIFVNAFGNDAIEILLRVWVVKENYLPLKSELLETIKYMFDEKGFSIPFHQMDITVRNEK